MAQDVLIAPSVAIAEDAVEETEPETPSGLASGVATGPERVAFSEPEKQQLRDAEKLVRDLICGNINAALIRGQKISSPLRYSERAKHVFHFAWTLAVQFQNKKVTLDHILLALARETGGSSKELGDAAAAEPTQILAGALVRVSVLSVIAGLQTIEAVLPTEAVLRWIHEASRVAAQRPSGNGEIDPVDLVAVLTSADADASTQNLVKQAIQRAVRVERTQGELVKARQGIDSLSMTTGYFRKETSVSLGAVAKQLEEANARIADMGKSVATLSGTLQAKPDDSLDRAGFAARLDDVQRTVMQFQAAQAASVTDLGRRTEHGFGRLVPVLQGFRDQLAAQPTAGPSQISAEIAAKVERNKMLAALEQSAALAQSLKDCRYAIDAIGKQATAIEVAMPRPLRARTLACLVAGVVALGIAAGVILSQATKSGWLAAALDSLPVLF